MPTALETRPERRSSMPPETRRFYVPSSYQAFRLLQAALLLVPLVAGIDKFVGSMVDWRMYLAGGMGAALGVPSMAIVRLAGVVELAIAAAVFFVPRVGGAALAAWYSLVMAHLLSGPSLPDIALLHGGLALAAVALSRLSAGFDRLRAAAMTH